MPQRVVGRAPGFGPKVSTRRECRRGDGETQLENNDLDTSTLQKRAKVKDESKAAERRIAELEHENRGLGRRLERADLIVQMTFRGRTLGRFESERRDAPLSSSRHISRATAITQTPTL